MTEHSILTKTASSGQRVEVFLVEQATGSYYLRATVDGQGAASGHLQPLPPKAAAKTPATHHLGGKVGFTAEETARIEAACAAAKAAYAASPEGQSEALRAERDKLTWRITALIDEDARAFERMMEDGDNDGACPPRSRRAEIEAAEEARRAFDREHPEVLAQIRSEKEEQTRRFLAAD